MKRPAERVEAENVIRMTRSKQKTGRSRLAMWAQGSLSPGRVVFPRAGLAPAAVLALCLMPMSHALAEDAGAGVSPRAVVPLSAAFTLEGYGGASESGLFSEYVLHVAMPEREKPVAIAGWLAPRDEGTWFEGARTAVVADTIVLPPRRPPVLARVATLPSGGAGSVGDGAAADAGMMSVLMRSRPMSMVRRWAVAMPVPDLQPAQQKVAGAISSLGERVSGLLPRF